MNQPWILTGIAPNLEADDVHLAWTELRRPFGWQKGNDVDALERAMSRRIGISHAVAFESGRTALTAVLHALGIGAGDDVLLQAFTCVAVPNAVRWVGANPVFVDCAAETFNVSLTDLEQKVTSKTKAVIFQHTFGNPSGIEEAVAFAKQCNLLIIEDAAHVLGGSVGGKAIGTFGQAAIVSFGRDKPISAVFGGMVITSDAATAEKLRSIQSDAGASSMVWTMRQLLHGPILSIAKRHYGNAFGRGLLALARALHLISLAVTAGEKRGERPGWTGRKMAPTLARLALHQLEKLDQFNQHRRDMERAYRLAWSEGVFQRIDERTEAPLLRLTALVEDAKKARTNALREQIVLGNWYDAPIAPAGTDCVAIGYVRGSCPAAERLATQAVNLPTDIHVSVDDVPRIIHAVRGS